MRFFSCMLNKLFWVEEIISIYFLVRHILPNYNKVGFGLPKVEISPWKQNLWRSVSKPVFLSIISEVWIWMNQRLTPKYGFTGLIMMGMYWRCNVVLIHREAKRRPHGDPWDSMVSWVWWNSFWISPAEKTMGRSCWKCQVSAES